MTEANPTPAQLREHAGALRIVRSQEELGYRLIEWIGDPPSVM